MDSVERLEFLLLLKADMLVGQREFNKRSSVPFQSCFSSPSNFCYLKDLVFFIFLQNVWLENTLLQDVWILSVSNKTGQRCKSRWQLFNTHTALQITTAGAILSAAAQQIGHYTDWIEQIATNNVVRVTLSYSIYLISLSLSQSYPRLPLHALLSSSRFHSLLVLFSVCLSLSF